ncbi:MAG: hypothetical protein LBV42_04255 [Methanobrevibacter sp.]|jgi:uncharacterized protein HemY|nr:hypothetical protein [Methanobrevibacter sp.]
MKISCYYSPYIKKAVITEENILKIINKIPPNDYQFQIKAADHYLKSLPEFNNLLMFKLEVLIINDKFEENMDNVDTLSKTNKNWKMYCMLNQIIMIF